MSIDELRAALEADNWRFGPQHMRKTGVDWYAWRRLDGGADCECNDKPPCLCLRPFHIEMQDGQTFSSVEFDVTGETGGRWLKISAYSVPIDDAIAAIPQCRQMLLTAWNAVAGLASKE